MTRIRVCSSLQTSSPFLTRFSPDIVQGFESQDVPDLGETGRRDPDALPPQNAFQLVMNWVHRGISELAGGNSLFALKAGILTSMYLSPLL